MSKNVIFCSTPLHILNALIVKFFLLKNDYVDLVILNHSNFEKKVIENIIEEKIFNNVIFLNVNDFNHQRLYKTKIKYIKKSIEYFFLRKYGKRFSPNDVIYDTVWTSFMDRSTWLYYLYLKEKNFNLKLNILPDGTGVYKLLSTRQNIIEEKILNFFNKKPFLKEINCLYIYEPSLIDKNYYNINIKSLPKIDDRNFQHLLNKIFKIDSNIIDVFLTNKFFYFEAPFIQKEAKVKQEKLISYFCKNNIKIKIHPRTIIKDNVPKSCIIDNNIFFESLFLKINFKNKVFISGISSATLFSKLIFNQEPYVIFLYKLYDLDKYTFGSDNYLDFLEKFKSLYSDTNKVFIPETLNEFYEIIERLKDED